MSSLEQIFSQAKNSFSASHFLVGFDKCDRLHGHNYSVTVHLKYNKVDLTTSIDFRTINAVIKHEVKLLDQKILLPKKSSKIQIHSTLEGKNWQVIVDDKKYSFPKQDVLIINKIEQTTTENLAFYLHQKLRTWLRQNHPNLVSILGVEIAENPGNQAKYSAPV
jgi:6-pyruvoyltetrahydropterin/6-carboxytetrahydropterin synthase